MADNRSLALIAREVAAEGDLPDDPAEAAEYVARQVMLERPDVKLSSARRAAAEVVPGADKPLTDSEMTEALSAPGRGRRAAATAGGAAARAARQARRALPAPSFRGARSGVGLVGQAFGLVVLYWLLRTPAAIESVTGGLKRALTWLAGPGGVGAPAAVASPGIADVLSGAVPRPGGVNVPPGSLDGLGPDTASTNAAVERWRPLVARYFAASEVPKAMAVLACESEGNPNAQNPTSGAAGLFQHIPRYFAARAAAAGFPGASPFDPEANVAAAAWLHRREGWRPWACA